MAPRKKRDSQKTPQESACRDDIADSWKTKAKDPLVWFTALLAIATILLVCVADKTDQTLKDTLRANIASLRPIVWLKDLDRPGDPQPFLDVQSNRIAWNYAYTNYGKSPAVKVRSRAFIKIGNGPFELSDSGIPDGGGVPLPPNKIDWATALSKSRYTEAEFTALKAIAGGVTIKISFDYSDIYETTYVSDVCLYNLPNGATAYCPGNNMK